MSKLQSSQELVLHQINAEKLRKTHGNASGTQHAVGGSSAAAAAILTPEIHDRPEWFSSLQDVSMYSLPSFLNTPVEVALHTKLHYVADKFDLYFLATKVAQNNQQFTTSPDGVGGYARTGVEEAEIRRFEDLITSFELQAHKGQEIQLNKLSTSGNTFEEAFVREVFCYWVRKRRALGGNIPCIPSLKIRVTEENQDALCPSIVLGDCPIPFKSREWESALILRQCFSPFGLTHKKRKKKMSRASTQQLCRSALSLSLQMFIREQLQCQHTYSSLYELSYLRSLGLSSDNKLGRDLSTDINKNIPSPVTFGFTFLPSIEQ